VDPDGGAEPSAGDQADAVPADGASQDAVLSDATPPGPEPLVADEFAEQWSGSGLPGPADLAPADDDKLATGRAARPGPLARARVRLEVMARRVPAGANRGGGPPTPTGKTSPGLRWPG
jgi:hypothetical protein